MDRLFKMAGGFGLGVVLGAGLGLLLAPRSGAETQQWIQERVQAILEEGRQAAEERRLELTERLEALKQPGSQV